MARKDIGVGLNRDNRNAINHNFIELYKGQSDYSAKLNQVEQNMSDKMDNFIEDTSNAALNKVVDNAKLDWLNPVDSYDKLPKDAKKGDTVMTRDNGYVYRFDGEQWIEIQEIDAGPVNELDSRLNKQLADKVERVGGNFRSPVYTMTYGNELLPDKPTASTGWTGDNLIGYTHTSGNENILRFTLPNLDVNKTYYISFNTNDTVDMNGISNFYITLGGTDKFETYKGLRTFYEYAFKPGGLDDYLRIIPRSGWSGTITNLTVKEITGVIPPTLTVYSHNQGRSAEIRADEHAKQNTFYGTNSGRYNMGERNTFFGYGAGQENTTGFWNTLLGWNAGRDNTVGTRNVAIGMQALLHNTSGDRNIAIGSFSMRGNKSGRANIAIGADSLWYNETGENNIAIGLVALGNNTSGRNNIALGERVMSGSEKGFENVAIGKLALYYNEGSHNFASGTQSMYRNKTGSKNIAIGYYSLFFNESGSDNIALGNEALRQNLTGGNNIALGKEALRDNAAGVANIAIGMESAAKTKATGNIAIGVYALKENESGGGNTTIGYSALTKAEGERNIAFGRNSGAGTESGNYNVFLGASAGASANNGDNNILIGYNVQKISTQASDQLNIGNIIKSKDMKTGLVEIPKLKLTDLPTSNPSESGVLWNDNGTLKISS